MDFLTTEEVAAAFRVPVATVRQWRHRGVGPKAAKIGRHVRYARVDVERWAEAQADKPRMVS